MEDESKGDNFKKDATERVPPAERRVGDAPPYPESGDRRQANNPLHGVTLERMVEELVRRHGWAEMGRVVRIRCFQLDPSVQSSLRFLRRTPWARAEVEAYYLRSAREERE